MKGLVFTTFYEFCEHQFGAEMLDDVIDDAALPHGGAYTSVGTYPFEEMVAVISALVKRSGLAMKIILEQFGQFCFACWVTKFPELFTNRDLFDVLASIDDFHESEVRKLYPDAELPSFRMIERSAHHVIMDYRSCKPLADLAVGVVRGAGEHLKTPVSVSYDAKGASILFRVERIAAQRLAA